MSTFKMDCPYCGYELEADTEWIGTPTKCPVCSKLFLIPDSCKDLQPGEKCVIDAVQAEEIKVREDSHFFRKAFHALRWVFVVLILLAAAALLWLSYTEMERRIQKAFPDEERITRLIRMQNDFSKEYADLVETLSKKEIYTGAIQTSSSAVNKFPGFEFPDEITENIPAFSGDLNTVAGADHSLAVLQEFQKKLALIRVEMVTPVNALIAELRKLIGEKEEMVQEEPVSAQRPFFTRSEEKKNTAQALSALLNTFANDTEIPKNAEVKKAARTLGYYSDYIVERLLLPEKKAEVTELQKIRKMIRTLQQYKRIFTKDWNIDRSLDELENALEKCKSHLAEAEKVCVQEWIAFSIRAAVLLIGAVFSVFLIPALADFMKIENINEADELKEESNN